MIVYFQIYELCENIGYTLIGLAVSVPCVLIPLLLPGKADRQIPLTQRYWFKANVWIAIISFIGNYFWTHYFYVVLRTSYTFPTTWSLNKVPVYLYLITHAYFCSYHTIAGIILRRFRHSTFYLAFGKGPMSILPDSGAVVILAVSVAFMEAFSISSVPYYNYPDATLMYTVGSVFYGIYFYVSFPMFARIDEKVDSKAKPKEFGWTATQAALDSFAACMIVTLLLDLWRLSLGPLLSELSVEELISTATKLAKDNGVPFVF